MPDVSAAIGALWERFKGVAFDRLEQVEAAAIAQLEGQLDPASQRRVEREAHKLAGSLGTFGFAEGSRLARELEVLLQGPLGEAETLRLSDLTVALRRTLEARGGSSRPAAPQPARTAVPTPELDARPLLLIVDGAGRLGRLAENEAPRLRVRTASDAEELRVALAAESPDIVVIDLQFGGRTEMGLAALADVLRSAPRARAVALTSNDSETERSEVARRGAAVLLPALTTTERIADAITDLLARSAVDVRRILAVTEDAQTMSALVHELRGPRVDVATQRDPQRFWETLERVRPDVLLLAEHLTNHSGSELCAILRADPRWAGLPVFLLTDDSGAEAAERAFGAGADDFVPRRFAGAELRARIAERLERRRLQRELADLDPLTGVANRRHVRVALEQIVLGAYRVRRPAAIALVDLDGLDEVNELHGEAAGDAVLCRTARLLEEAARPGEIVGRWTGDTFVVAAVGTERDDGVRRLRDVLDRLRADAIRAPDGTPLSASFSAGVAVCPADGTDARALVRAATQALDMAKREGPGMVLPVGWREQPPCEPAVVDVVLVEDDVALAGLLSHTLETRGQTTRVVADGGEAIEALCGTSPRLQARVIVLDVDLPGRDGFEVLRALARDGVTERSRVVMLTAHTTEPEIVHALELGAFDHVGKPFSVQILMQRLRRALGD